MLSKLKKNNNEGFTIIEVMIVLAIAGLILLIVFLAVPALQRNSRNTQRKNDVSGLLAAVSEFSNNNNGSTPGTCLGTSTVVFGTAPNTSEAKVGYYNGGCAFAATTTAGDVGLLKIGASNVNPPANSSTAAADYINIYLGGICDATTSGQVDVGSARSIAAQYQIETGAGKYQEQCQAS